MTNLPPEPKTKLGLVIDLDTCVGCHACVIACKGWNTEHYGTPLSDVDAYGANPVGTFLNRVHSFEVEPKGEAAQIVYFPKSCLHCDDAPCVTVCPTGASYKRAEDGIVLVYEDHCIGCGLCAWACPYGARELDPKAGVMKKCTLCVDRIENTNLPPEDRVPACVRTCPAGARHFGDLADPESTVSKLVEERGGFDLMPEQKTRPVNKYLPPRMKDPASTFVPLEPAYEQLPDEPELTGFLGWLDRSLDRI
ncbi:MAG: 4Fe-4S dicluster domain-containing protein [Pseudomonadota bacterium]